MPISDFKPDWGWYAHRTWNATKVVLKNLTNVTGQDFLEPGASSVFDFKEDQSNIKHLLIMNNFKANKAFYDNAKDLKDRIGYAVEIPMNLACLDSITAYLAKRSEVIKTDEALKTPLDDETKKLQSQFKALQADLKERVIDGDKIGLFSLVNELFRLKAEATKVLEKQHEKDMKAIGTSESGALEKAHTEAFKAFEDAMNTEINIELNKARIENTRLALVKLWQEKGSEETKRILKEAISKDDPGAVTVTAEGQQLKSERLDLGKALGKMTRFKTLSGLDVEQKKPGAFTIQIPGRYNFIYHNGLQDNVAADLQLLALSVKASGAKTITFELEGANIDNIHLLARKAYEAGIKAGFKGGINGEIHFTVNGKVMKLLDEVDKDNKSIKGVFANEHDMMRYESRDLEESLRSNERGDPKWEGRDPEEVGEDSNSSISGGSTSDEHFDLTGGSSIKHTKQYKVVLEELRSKGALSNTQEPVVDQGSLNLTGGGT